jgi:hypothetical protein
MVIVTADLLMQISHSKRFLILLKVGSLNPYLLSHSWDATMMHTAYLCTILDTRPQRRLRQVTVFIQNI